MKTTVETLQGSRIGHFIDGAFVAPQGGAYAPSYDPTTAEPWYEFALGDARDVDAAVRYGFGLRYIAAGPLLQKDLGGIDIHYAAAKTMYPHLHNDQEPSAYMRRLVEEGHIGVKSPARKGFYDWTEDRIAAEQLRYETALLKAINILLDEEARKE